MKGAGDYRIKGLNPLRSKLVPFSNQLTKREGGKKEGEGVGQGS